MKKSLIIGHMFACFSCIAQPLFTANNDQASITQAGLPHTLVLTRISKLGKLDFRYKFKSNHLGGNFIAWSEHGASTGKPNIYQTTDEGESWQSVYKMTAKEDWWDIDFVPQEQGELYAIVGTEQNEFELRESHDYAQSWSKVDTTCPIATRTDGSDPVNFIDVSELITLNEKNNSVMFSFDPLSPSKIGVNGVFLSTDNALTCRLVLKGSYLVEPSDDGKTIFAIPKTMDYKYLMVSRDYGNSWQNSFKLTDSVYSIATKFDPINGQNVFLRLFSIDSAQHINTEVWYSFNAGTRCVISLCNHIFKLHRFFTA